MLVCVRATDRDTHKACADRPASYRLRVNLPERFANTTAGVSATRCPARSADRRPAPTKPPPSASLCGLAPAAHPRTDRVPAPATTFAPTSTLPTAAADITAALTIGPAPSTHRRWPLHCDLQQKVKACSVVLFLVRRPRSIYATQTLERN